MSYESVVTDLKALLRHELLQIDPSEHRKLVQSSESDRAAIILSASMIETFLVHALNERMPSLNGEERDRIFQFEGPCGSFSNRIRMAQALGILSRPMRRKLDLLREMRNVSAHAHPDINFDTPQIRQAVITLLDEPYRGVARRLPRDWLRRAFVQYCAALNHVGTGGFPTDAISAWFAKAEVEFPEPPDSSPDKPPKPKRTGRPAKARKGKPPSRPPTA